MNSSVGAGLRRLPVGGGIVAVLAVAASLGIAPAASAAVTIDPRATAFDGNVTTCAQVGLAGGQYGFGDEQAADPTGVLTFTGGQAPEIDTFLSISAVASGYTVTGVVMKGGGGYNVYLPADLGDLTWADLHSPQVGAGDRNTPTISHWFACATQTPPADPPLDPPIDLVGDPVDPPLDPPIDPVGDPVEPPLDPDGPGDDEPVVEDETVPMVASVFVPVSQAPGEVAEETASEVLESTALPATGAGSMWLAGAAFGLLVAGSTIVVATRRRRLAGV